MSEGYYESGFYTPLFESFNVFNETPTAPGETVIICWKDGTIDYTKVDGFILEQGFRVVKSTTYTTDFVEIYRGLPDRITNIETNVSYHYVEAKIPEVSEVPEEYYYGIEQVDGSINYVFYSSFRLRAYGLDGKETSTSVNEQFVVVSTGSNGAPTVPTYIEVPSSIKSGTTVTVSWGYSTDDDGNFEGYILERSTNGGTSWTQIYQGSERSVDNTVASGLATVKYRVKAYDSSGAESEYCTSATITITNNSAPTTPSSISVPSSIQGGSSISISWGTSTDEDGNLSGYQLEVSTNGGSTWTTVYSGLGTTTTYSVVYGTSSVVFRVKAYDSEGASSGYKVSSTVSVTNNTAPVISGSNSNLGTKTAIFTQTYSVTDAEGGTVTVVEKVDGVTTKSYQVTLGATNTFYFSENGWLSLGNGSHSMTITATDSQGESATRTYTFTKSETEIYLTYQTAITATEMPTVGVYYISKEIPEGATFSVKVCNNGFDSSPTWEDITGAVEVGGRFYFNNQSKTSSKWGVNAIIEVKRNSAVGDCYISSVRGYFR